MKKEGQEKRVSLLAAEIAEKINRAAEQGIGNQIQILNIVIALVAPHDWYLKCGRT